MITPTAPSTTGWPYSPAAPATIAVTGSASNPTKVHASTASAIAFSGTGWVTVVVDSDWKIGNGEVLVPPSVHATFYIGGNIEFGNSRVNDPANPINSGKPGDLLIYGTAPIVGSAITTNGTPVVSAAIYAPTYNILIKGGGGGTFYGSLVANSYDMNGGGNLSLHYDEILAEAGLQLPRSYSISSYFEDNRR